jgi:spore germination protein KC
MKKGKILITLVIFSGMLLFISLIQFKDPLGATYGIEENFFVIAVAIDKGIEKEGNVRITVSSEKFLGGSSSSSSTETKLPEIISSEGQTMFEAQRNFYSFYNKKIFWSHIKCILISEDIAKEDVLKYLDFLIRDHELRFDSTVAIVKGTTGEEVLKLGKKNKEYILDTLLGIFDNADRLEISKDIKLKKVMQMFSNKNFGGYIPSIKITSEKDAEKKDVFKLKLDGYALFYGVKLKEFISGNVSRGLNWVNGDVSSTTLVVQDKNNNNVSLEVLNSNPKIDVELKNNIPKANITLEVSSNFAEEMSQNFLFKNDDINFLIEKQNELIKGEIESALKILQENQIDAIGMSDKIYRKYPLEWDNIKNNWKQLFKNMDINVTVKSKINRTYHIEETIGSESGGK